MVQLAGVLRLRADRVESRGDGAGAGGLHAAVIGVAGVDLLFVVDVVIGAGDVERFGVELVVAGDEDLGAGSGDAEDAALAIRRAGEGAVRLAAELVLGILIGPVAVGDRDGAADTGSVLVEIGGVLVERQRALGHMRDRVVEQLRGGQSDGGGGRQHVAQAFGIEQEVELVLLHGTADGARVLVGIRARNGVAGEGDVEIARVERLAVVVVAGIAVEAVGAALADDIFLTARHASVLGAEGVQNHGHFGDLIRAEGVVAGAGVVEVVVRIHDVRAVQGELNGRAGDAVGVHVAAAALDVDAHAGHGHGEGGEVAAGHGEIGNQIGVEGAGEIRVLGLQRGDFGADFDDFFGAFDGEREVHFEILADQDGYLIDRRLEARRGSGQSIDAGRKKGKAVLAGAVGIGLSGGSGFGARDADCGIGDDATGGIGNRAADVAGGQRLRPRGRRQDP